MLNRIILLLLILLVPVISYSEPFNTITKEGEMIDYYIFKENQHLLQRDLSNEVNKTGHIRKHEALSEIVIEKILQDPEANINKLNQHIIKESEAGIHTGRYYNKVYEGLRTRLLDHNMNLLQPLRELEQLVSSEQTGNSGYLSFLERLSGSEGYQPDEEYLRFFSKRPWNQGLLKFYGDTLYFTRQFDSAIKIYNKILDKIENNDSTYSSFYESEVRNRLGSCYLIQKDYIRSSEQFYKASTLTDVPEAVINQLFEAHSLIRDQKYDEALVILDNAKKHKFIPEALVNSMLVQEAVIFKEKGESETIVKILKKFENVKNSSFLLKPDNRFVYRLLEEAFRKLGNEEKMIEMRNKLKNTPPISAIDKLDPMVAEYDKFAERITYDVQFKVDDSWTYSTSMTNLIGSRPEFEYRVVYYDSETGELVETSAVTPSVKVTYPEIVPAKIIDTSISPKANVFKTDSDIIPGTYFYDFMISSEETGSYSAGRITLNKVGYKLTAIKFNGQDIDKYYENFDDFNGNGVFDEDEDKITNWNPDTITPDTLYTSYHASSWSWANDDNNIGLIKYSQPAVYARTETNRDISITPRFQIVWGKTTEKKEVKESYLPSILLKMKFISITNQAGKKNIPLFVWKYDLEDASDYSPLEKDVTLRQFPLSPGVRKYKVEFSMSIDGTEIPDPMGVSEIKLIIPRKKPLKNINYYLPLIEHSAKVIGNYQDTKASENELVRELVRKAKDLRSNVNDSIKLKYRITNYYSLDESGLDNGLSGSMNQFLDEYGGNGEAWCNALRQMANFQGIPLKTVKFKNYYGSYNTRTWGINQDGVPMSTMNILTGAFPGVPKDLDLEKKNFYYQYIQNHAINILKDNDDLWLFDPSLYTGTNHEITAIKGKFPVLKQFLDKKNKDILFAKYNEFTEFNQRYLSRLFHYFTINHMPYFKSSGDKFVLDYKKISIPTFRMLTRPAYISFMESYSPLSSKIKEKLVKISKFIKKNMNTVVSGSEDYTNPGADEPENAAQKEILKLGAMMKPGSYESVLDKCEDFLRKTDSNSNPDSYEEYENETYVLTYIYSRALILFAADEFGKQYHIPGWEHNKTGFLAYQKTLMGDKQIKAIDRLLNVTNYHQNSNHLDEYADVRYIIAKYYQMAGFYDEALKLLNQVKEKHDADPEMFRNHYPLIIWLMAETYTYKKDYEKAIQLKSELIDNYDKYEDLVKTARYSRASDYLFSEKYKNAKDHFKEFSQIYPSSDNTPGAKIFWAYAVRKLDTGNNTELNEAERILKSVIDPAYNNSEIENGYKPMAYLSLMSLYTDNHQYKKAIELSDEFNRFRKRFKNSGSKYFYEAWLKTHLTGILVKRAVAFRLQGDNQKGLGKVKEATDNYATAFDILKGVEELDDGEYKNSAIGLPFPRMVYPVWGSDLGDYENLLKDSFLGKKLDKSLKLRKQEYGKIKVKYVNQYKNAAKFNKAMTYLSRNAEGDREKAEKILMELGKTAKKKKSKDFLVLPIVGADLFLIAISPQTIDKYVQIAKDFFHKMPAKIVCKVDGIELDNNKKLYLKKDPSFQKMLIEVHNFYGQKLDFKNLKVKYSINNSLERVNASEISITTANSGHYNLKIVASLKDFEALKVIRNVDICIYSLEIHDIVFQNAGDHKTLNNKGFIRDNLKHIYVSHNKWEVKYNSNNLPIPITKSIIEWEKENTDNMPICYVRTKLKAISNITDSIMVTKINYTFKPKNEIMGFYANDKSTEIKNSDQYPITFNTSLNMSTGEEQTIQIYSQILPKRILKLEKSLNWILTIRHPNDNNEFYDTPVKNTKHTFFIVGNDYAINKQVEGLENYLTTTRMNFAFKYIMPYSNTFKPGTPTYIQSVGHAIVDVTDKNLGANGRDPWEGWKVYNYPSNKDREFECQIQALMAVLTFGQVGIKAYAQNVYPTCDPVPNFNPPNTATNDYVNTNTYYINHNPPVKSRIVITATGKEIHSLHFAGVNSLVKGDNYEGCVRIKDGSPGDGNYWWTLDPPGRFDNSKKLLEWFGSEHKKQKWFNWSTGKYCDEIIDVPTLIDVKPDSHPDYGF